MTASSGVNASLVPLVIAAGLRDKGDLHISFVPGMGPFLIRHLATSSVGNTAACVAAKAFIFKATGLSWRRRCLKWGSAGDRSATTTQKLACFLPFF